MVCASRVCNSIREELEEEEERDLYSGDVVAIHIGLKGDHVGGGPPVYQALIQHMVDPLQLPFPANAAETPQWGTPPSQIPYAACPGTENVWGEWVSERTHLARRHCMSHTMVRHSVTTVCARYCDSSNT